MAKNDNGKSKADQYREERKARLAKAAKKTASKSEKSMKLQKTVQKAISIALVLALVSLIGWNILGLTGTIQIMTPVMTVGNEKISARDFSYYYILMYKYTENQSKQYQQQYGQDVMGFDATKLPDEQNYPQPNEAGETITWAKYLSDTAIDRAQQYEALYAEAMAADKTKYTMTEEEKTTLNDQIEQIRTTAAKQSLSINAFLREFYGKGVNERFLRKQLEKETIVSRYSDDKNKEFEAAWTDEKVKAAYDADKDSYDVVSLRIFSFTPATLKANTGEGADALAIRQKAENDATKAKADAMLTKITDDTSFQAAAEANKVLAEGEKFDKDADTANFNKTKSSVESAATKDAAEWAFADGRNAGDKSVFQNDTGKCFVVWVQKAQYAPITVDVRHILLSFKEDQQSQEPATTEEIAAAKNKADSVYKTWQDGAKTEDSFAELAKTMSTDPGSKDKGGLYEDVKVGSMVAPFENWCFDPAKKPGDTGIVETTYGFHVMYMVNNDPANFQYITDIRTAKASEDNEKYLKDLMDSDTYKLTKNAKNITNAEVSTLKIIDTLIKTQSSN